MSEQEQNILPLTEEILARLLLQDVYMELTYKHSLTILRIITLPAQADDKGTLYDFDSAPAENRVRILEHLSKNGSVRKNDDSETVMTGKFKPLFTPPNTR